MALVVALATGCSSDTHVARSGTLVVGIHYAGGPKHRWDQLFAGRVVIFNRHGQLAATLRVKDGRTADVVLPPGRYSVGYGHGHPTARRLGGCPPKIATVRVGRVTQYRLVLGCLIL